MKENPFWFCLLRMVMTISDLRLGYNASTSCQIERVRIVLITGTVQFSSELARPRRIVWVLLKRVFDEQESSTELSARDGSPLKRLALLTSAERGRST